MQRKTPHPCAQRGAGFPSRSVSAPFPPETLPLLPTSLTAHTAAHSTHKLTHTHTNSYTLSHTAYPPSWPAPNGTTGQHHLSMYTQANTTYSHHAFSGVLFDEDVSVLRCVWGGFRGGDADSRPGCSRPLTAPPAPHTGTPATHCLSPVQLEFFVWVCGCTDLRSRRPPVPATAEAPP